METDGADFRSVCRTKLKDLAAKLNTNVGQLFVRTAEDDVIHLKAPNDAPSLPVSAVQFKLVSGLVFTFALVLAVKFQLRWGYKSVSQIMDRGRHVALEVWQRLMPRVMTWGDPNRSLEKNARSSTYIALCVRRALCRVLASGTEQLERKSVSIDSEGTDSELEPSHGIVVADRETSIELKLLRKEQARLLMREFTRQELLLMGKSITLKQWVERGRARNISHADQMRRALLHRARVVLQVDGERKSARTSAERERIGLSLVTVSE